MTGSKNWTFTLNNYTEADVERIDGLVQNEAKVQYIIYGKEVGANGTPHLQGFINVNRRCSLQVVKALIGGNPHVEIARRVPAAIQYCKKDNDWKEFGALKSIQGRRSDLEEFKDAVKGGMLSTLELREHHSEVMARYPRFVMDYIQDHSPEVSIPEYPFRPWQEFLHNKLQLEPDRRKIIFVVDEVGNSGKTWFAHFFSRQKGNVAQVLLPGRLIDMAYSLRAGLKYVFMDAPRSKQGEYIAYDFLESLKNGYVFSSKYESRIKSYDPMHVVVNLNEMPDRSQLSADRYDILNIRQLS